MNPMKIVAALCFVAAAGCNSADGACDRIVEACHDVDPGSGPIHDCHEDAEAAEAASDADEICADREDDCIALCKP
jgi:hypothetical protein